jgi:hypothetical protein
MREGGAEKGKPILAYPGQTRDIIAKAAGVSHGTYEKFKVVDAKVGELTSEIPREVGGRPEKNSAHRGQSLTPLQSAGIESNLRKRCEQIAAQAKEPANVRS